MSVSIKQFRKVFDFIESEMPSTDLNDTELTGVWKEFLDWSKEDPGDAFTVVLNEGLENARVIFPDKIDVYEEYNHNRHCGTTTLRRENNTLIATVIDGTTITDEIRNQIGMAIEGNSKCTESGAITEFTITKVSLYLRD